MKIMVVHLNNINLCPPAISLVENLIEQKHEVMIIAYNIDELKSNIIMSNNIHMYNLGKYITPTCNIRKYVLRMKDRIHVRKYIKKNVSKCDVIWTTSEITVREIGKILLKTNKKHIMQLMELTDFVPLFGGYRCFKFKIEKYAQAAYKVVVPEINRAHIVKVKWNLKYLPEVLPNKPYTHIVNKQELSQKANEIISYLKCEKRKVILYQGGFTKDRKFEQFIKAMNSIGDQYVLCLMGKDNDYRKEICKSNPTIEYLGFLNPPEHLIIAQYAHIGILTYFPVRDGFYSDLNAVFCAPNKTFEYALCQLPMIGTNVPGLSAIFEKFNVGCCIKQDNAEAVIEAIQYIEENYQEMKNNCIRYFESVDLVELVKKILE